MSKKLEVYNAYFGDCIILKDISDDTNLLVDFGIHYYSIVSKKDYTNRTTLTGRIANNIAKRYPPKSISLLITHFHEDHVSGLIYMYKKQKRNPKYQGQFKNIYIANVWNNPFAVASNIMEGMLLEYELKNSGLPRTSISLLDLLDFLQGYSRKITLLSKGVSFEDDKYIALWPPKYEENKDLTNVLSGFGLPEDLENSLIELAKMVCDFVMLTVTGEELPVPTITEKPTTHVTIEKIQNKYNDAYKSFENYINSDNYIGIDKGKLNELNHEYNIVFQNRVNGDENILFTGDAEKSHMNNIASDTDIPLHQHFKYIKIPHHGTNNHYFDFSSYTPDNVVITNGSVNVSNPNSYKICTGYGSLKARHLCTNSDNCCNCMSRCSVSTQPCGNKRILVYRDLYKTF